MEAKLLLLVALIGYVTAYYGESLCKKEQREGFEFIGENPGIAGIFIPVCESNGDYRAVQCPGADCQCVTREGEHIKGYDHPWREVRLGTMPEKEKMNCHCARDFYEYQQTGLIGLLFHCQDNGNYHPVQCTGSVCYCVDLHGQQAANGPTAPIQDRHTLQC